jgi:hypothetical protein
MERKNITYCESVSNAVTHIADLLIFMSIVLRALMVQPLTTVITTTSIHDGCIVGM